MDERTSAYLNSLNRTFYDHYAGSFDDTRRAAWPGWKRLSPLLRPGMRLWDAGCGNGRFARFAVEQVGSVTYTGTDSSAGLLAAARVALADLPDVTLSVHDLLTDPLPDAQYDLITAFGVLHHVPGVQRRRDLICGLAERVSAGGMLVFTAWRFADYERFRAHYVPWETLDPGFPLSLDSGDHLLDWQGQPSPPRYCHHTDDAEHDAFVAASGLTPIDDYRADGFDARVNRYSVLLRN